MVYGDCTRVRALCGAAPRIGGDATHALPTRPFADATRWASAAPVHRHRRQATHRAPTQSLRSIRSNLVVHTCRWVVASLSLTNPLVHVPGEIDTYDETTMIRSLTVPCSPSFTLPSLSLASSLVLAVTRDAPAPECVCVRRARRATRGRCGLPAHGGGARGQPHGVSAVRHRPHAAKRASGPLASRGVPHSAASAVRGDRGR